MRSDGRSEWITRTSGVSTDGTGEPKAGGVLDYAIKRGTRGHGREKEVIAAAQCCNVYVGTFSLTARSAGVRCSASAP